VAKIACLGWGSLIWDPRSLPLETRWFKGGPYLPVEFLRASRDGRITLVLDDSATPVRSLWAVLKTSDLKTAIRALGGREETPEGNIGVWRAAQKAPMLIPQLAGWARKRHVNAVVWTNLPRRFNSQTAPASVDQVIAYLKGLDGVTLAKAREYVRRAPCQIDTAYRRAIVAALGWECEGK
jgi:hypothetical protein